MARYANEVTPADVGGRVSVRHRLANADADGPSLTDVVGTLDAWADGVLVVTRRDGTTVRVHEDAVVGSRRLPAHPPERRRRG